MLAELAPLLREERTRSVVHVDLDAWYCQVEQKRLSIPTEQPCGVQQWCVAGRRRSRTALRGLYSA